MEKFNLESEKMHCTLESSHLLRILAGMNATVKDEHKDSSAYKGLKFVLDYLSDLSIPMTERYDNLLVLLRGCAFILGEDIDVTMTYDLMSKFVHLLELADIDSKEISNSELQSIFEALTYLLQTMFFITAYNPFDSVSDDDSCVF